MGRSRHDEERHGVPLTNLDQPLFDGAGATKRDLVDYVEAMADRLVAELHDRPLSVLRVHRGKAPFMQKNVPAHAPAFVRTATLWSETSQRDVAYALADDVTTLVWLANQRAVELHAALFRMPDVDHPTHLVLDLDPPQGAPFSTAVDAALLVRAALDRAGLEGVPKLSGAKGVHVYVPLAEGIDHEQAAAATRALAELAATLDPALATTAFLKDERGGRVFIDPTRVGGATVVAAYSPRARSGTPISLPVPWDELGERSPGDVTITNAAEVLGDADPWRDLMPAPQRLPDVLVEHGRTIPAPRVQAMHEGRRRARGDDRS